MTSVRFFIGRWSEGCDLMVQRITENLCHLVIETKPGDDSDLFLQLSIGADPNAVHAECDGVKGAEIGGVDDHVDDGFAPIGQVYKDILPVGHGRYSQEPRYWGNSQDDQPARESTA